MERQMKNIISEMKQKANSLFNNKIDWKTSVWAEAFIQSTALAIFSVKNMFMDMIGNLFPQTALGEFLDMFGEWENLPRQEATPATGDVVFTGDGVETIELNTVIQSARGVIYETTEEKDLALNEVDISSSVYDSGVVTVTTTTDHGLVTGQKANVGGEDVEAIEVTGGNTFRFEWGTVFEPSGVVSVHMAIIPVQSLSSGAETNEVMGTALAIITPVPAGVDEEAFSFFLTGGAEQEEDEDYRNRILFSRRQMRGSFSVDQCISAGLRIAGNTDIYHDPPIPGADDPVKDPGFQPRPGESVFYVLREAEGGGYEDPVSPEILEATKDAIIQFGRKPAHVSEDDIHVFSPIFEDVDIELSITPDTATMREAVEDSIDSFFVDNFRFNEQLSRNKLLSYIAETQDLQTGQFLEDFALMMPVIDIPFIPKTIAIKGTVTFL